MIWIHSLLPELKDWVAPNYVAILTPAIVPHIMKFSSNIFSFEVNMTGLSPLFLWRTFAVSRLFCNLAPHQPRLDWQMWFAALGSYHHNPWYINLISKLLHGEQDVLDLLGENPFPDKPPRFIRSTLYKYHYTRLPKNISGIISGLGKSR